MNRDAALARIRSLEPLLRQIGVAGAALFGSLARGDAGKDSDIDIAVRPEPGVLIGPTGLLDLYGLFADAFGHRQAIDVVVVPARDRELNEAIERDSVVAFS